MNINITFYGGVMSGTRMERNQIDRLQLNMDYLKELETAGFAVTRRKKEKKLPAKLLKRYRNIPAEYEDFL